MTRTWIPPLLAGAFIGASVALAFSYLLSRSVSSGSPVFRLKFQELTQKAGDHRWDIWEDETYSPLPPLGRRDRVGRRIVAHAMMSASDQQGFAPEFESAVEETVRGYGAEITGERGFNKVHIEARPAGQAPSQTVLNMPRHYYRIGGTHGVVDAWTIGQGGEVTVIICLTE